MMTRWRCPRCGRTIGVRACRTPPICAHGGTPHDAHKPCAMAAVALEEQEVA